jgi:hypothetical protein
MREALYSTVLPMDTMERLIRISGQRLLPGTPPSHILQCWQATGRYFCYTRPFHIHSRDRQGHESHSDSETVVATAASVVFLQSHILFNLALCWLTLGKLAGCATSPQRAGHLYATILRHLIKTKSLASSRNTNQSLVHEQSSTYGIFVCLILNNLTLVYCEQCHYVESESCRHTLKKLLRLRYPSDVISIVLCHDKFYDNLCMWRCVSFPTLYRTMCGE